MIMSRHRRGADSLKSREKASRPGCTQPYFRKEGQSETFLEPALSDYVPMCSFFDFILDCTTRRNKSRQFYPLHAVNF